MRISRPKPKQPLKLVFYSGGQLRENAELHRRVVELATSSVRRSARGRSGKPLTMTYIPFCTEGSKTYFYRAIRRYAPLGVVDFMCLDIEREPSRADIREALSSDIVYLSGGNTFFFLHQLKRLGMLPLLRDYAKRGGVLAGLSAGALILTPTIALAGVPGLDPDPNDVGLSDPRSLGLVPFEFAPHFSGSPLSIQRHLAYSRRSKHPIYASCDGGGLVVEGRSLSFIGPSWAFFRGRMMRVN